MWWLVIMVFGLLIPEILSTVLDSRLGRAVAAHIESRGEAVEADRLRERVGQLEGEVDRLSLDVKRLTEETNFVQKLLAGRASEGPPPSLPGERAAP